MRKPFRDGLGRVSALANGWMDRHSLLRAQVNPAFSTASIPKRPTGVRVSQLQ